MPDIKDIVKEKYGQAALRVTSGDAGCCSSSCCGGADLVPGQVDPITVNLYDAAQTSGLPEEAVLASLGCGNPTALAALNPGEVVLDLGSGGGIDVLLSAKRVGPSGKAYGLDMTDEMLALARANQQKAGVANVEFLQGEIEHIPLPDNTVDVIISNCVINLSADKSQVLREAFRVLKPGGRFAVSDVVVKGEIPDPIRRSVELWIGCLSGALEEQDYLARLRVRRVHRRVDRTHPRLPRRRRQDVSRRARHRRRRRGAAGRRPLLQRLHPRHQAALDPVGVRLDLSRFSSSLTPLQSLQFESDPDWRGEPEGRGRGTRQSRCGRCRGARRRP
jgi:arsenite methyltransferase